MTDAGKSMRYRVAGGKGIVAEIPGHRCGCCLQAMESKGLRSTSEEYASVGDLRVHVWTETDGLSHAVDEQAKGIACNERHHVGAGIAIGMLCRQSAGRGAVAEIP